MRLVDTHCHLGFPDYKYDLDEVVKRAEGCGVQRIIVPGTNVESSLDSVELTKRYASVFAAIGAHPHEADKIKDKEVLLLRKTALENDKIIAIGEIGLDYYRNYAEPDNQKKLFKRYLCIAKDLDYPVIIHNRLAGEDILSILKEEARSWTIRGVVHCFSDSEEILREFLFLGMYISFTGNVTFKNAGHLREIVKLVPLERLLLETDSPFMTPAALRGKRNEPANICFLLDVYSKIYGLTEEEIAEITTNNADRLFCLGMGRQGEVVYVIRESAYLNITNRCTNRCVFCTRQKSDYVYGYNLKLVKEPAAEEIIAKLGDVSKYKEIVFCGYGEPTLRLNVVKKIASYVKEKGALTRIITNGEGSLINLRDITNELKGLIDKVSVSLNAPDASTFNRLCRPVFGSDTYPAILDFIEKCIKQGIKVEITCLDILGEDGIRKCRSIAEDLGASFRLRQLDVVG